MPAAVAARKNPQLAGGNAMQREATGRKREKKKKKQSAKSKLPPFPDLRAYQPVPLCTSLTGDKPVWYAFHQVEQQIAQYAARILLEQQQQQRVIQPPKKRQLPKQTGKKQKTPQSSGRQQQKRADQQKQRPSQDAEEQQQHLQLQIHKLLNQHEQCMVHQRDPLTAAPRQAGHSAAFSGGLAASDASRSRLFHSDSAAHIPADSRTDYSITAPHESGVRRDTSKNSCTLEGPVWAGNTSPGERDDTGFTSSTAGAKTMAVEQKVEANDGESRQQGHPSITLAGGVSGNVPRGSYCSSLRTDQDNSSIYPSENFVMVVRRRPRDLKPSPATAGAAAAPVRPRTPASRKAGVSVRQVKKSAGRSTADDKRRGPASPGRSAKAASPRKKSSPRQQQSSSAACEGPPRSILSASAAPIPTATELRATFITQDKRFLEMQRDLNRYLNARRGYLVSENVCRRGRVDQDSSESPDGKAKRDGTKLPLSDGSPFGVSSEGESGTRESVTAVTSGVPYVPPAAQLYFKASIPEPPQKRVEPHWELKACENREAGNFEGTASHSTAAGPSTSDDRRDDETQENACVRFRDYAWDCLTGTAEAAAAAADSAQALAAALEENIDAPAREVAQQKLDTFYNTLAACLTELLLGSSDPTFRLAYLDTVYRWYHAKRPCPRGLFSSSGQGAPSHSLVPPVSAAPFSPVAPPSVGALTSSVSPTFSSSAASCFPSDTIVAGLAPVPLSETGVSSERSLAAQRSPATTNAAQTFESFYEAPQRPPPSFPLLKEAAAFDARHLSQYSGSAFLGCPYTSRGKLIDPSCSNKQLSGEGRFDSNESMDNIFHNVESGAADSAKFPYQRWSRTRESRVPRFSIMQGRSRTSVNGCDNCGAQDAVTNRRSSGNETRNAAAFHFSVPGAPDTGANSAAKREASPLRNHCVAGSPILLRDTSPRYEVPVPVGGDAAPYFVSGRYYDQPCSAGIAAGTVTAFKGMESSVRSPLTEAEALLAPEPPFLSVVQKHAPLITPMDRLREYKTRTLITPAAVVALQQQLHISRLSSPADNCLHPSYGSPGPPVAGATPTTRCSQSTTLCSNNQEGEPTAVGTTATRNTEMATTRAFRGSVLSPVTSGKIRSPRRETKTTGTSMSAWPQQMQGGEAERRMQQQQHHQSRQQLEPLQRNELLVQAPQSKSETDSPTAILWRTNSAEDAEAESNDLRFDYLGDWKPVRQPWGMQTPVQTPRSTCDAGTVAGREILTPAPLGEKRRFRASSNVEAGDTSSDAATAAAACAAAQEELHARWLVRRHREVLRARIIRGPRPTRYSFVNSEEVEEVEGREEGDRRPVRSAATAEEGEGRGVRPLTGVAVATSPSAAARGAEAAAAGLPAEHRFSRSTAGSSNRTSYRASFDVYASLEREPAQTTLYDRVASSEDAANIKGSTERAVSTPTPAPTMYASGVDRPTTAGAVRRAPSHGLSA